MKRKSIALLMVATLLVGCNPTKEAEKQKSIVRSTEATERINTADLEDILHTIDHVSSVNYVGNNQLLVIADQMYLMNVSSGKLLAKNEIDESFLGRVKVYDNGEDGFAVISIKIPFCYLIGILEFSKNFVLRGKCFLNHAVKR